MSRSDSVLAWHFIGKTLRDGRPIPKDGVWLRHEGPIVMCRSGLHASVDPFDTLQYAPGPILCRVECRRDMLHEADKLVCRERRILYRADATEGLRYFARMQALSVIHLWEPPDVVLDYLMTGEETIGAAAWAAAGVAARAAARAAAWWAVEAARGAAGVAARAAARAAAGAAVGVAARAEWNALVHEWQGNRS